jgi:hypothetical protein
MLKRVLATALLTLFVAVPVLAETDYIIPSSAMPPPNWLAREADLNALDGKVAMVEFTLTEKIARMERMHTEKVASLKEEMQNIQARLESEIQALRARLEPKDDREARMKPGQKQALRKPSPQAARLSLNAP